MLSLRVISQMMTNRLNIRLLLAKTKKVFACLMKNNCLVKFFHKFLKFKTVRKIYNLNQTRLNQYFKSFKIQKNSALIIYSFTYQTKAKNCQIKLFWENLSIFIEIVSKRRN
jgi:steroid 5-alpha reductase family enzyme